MLVEHARNVMGIGDAVHAEYGTSGTEVVSALACSLNGVDIDVRLAPGSRLRSLHGGAGTVAERATCSYGLNPAFQPDLERTGLVVSGTDPTGEARAVERADHPFFVATLYQPQLRSGPTSPHPVLTGFLRAATGSAS